METFKIEIIETLSRTIEIEANSQEEAIDKLCTSYTEEKIILDSSDHIGTEFHVS